jgi:type VI secretion system protein
MNELYGFIERLSGRSCLSPDDTPPRNVYESIRDHLVLLLNTRRGAIAHLPDYGLPDMSEVYEGYPDSLYLLAAEIKRTIERFEQRLIKVRIELISSASDRFEANYAIKGYLSDGHPQLTEVTFRTMISQGGRAEVGNS